MAARHVGKAADPHESIRTPPIAKLPDDGHSGSFLRFNEVSVEQIDQHVALTGLERTAATRSLDSSGEA